jgi:hypothetical protein
MVTVVEGRGSASSSSFCVMVPDAHALEQLACSYYRIPPSGSSTSSWSDRHTGGLPTDHTPTLIPRYPALPQMEASEGLMRKTVLLGPCWRCRLSPLLAYIGPWGGLSNCLRLRRLCG